MSFFGGLRNINSILFFCRQGERLTSGLHHTPRVVIPKTRASGFYAKPCAHGILCPKCGRCVPQAPMPKLGEDPKDKSLYVCVCGWESKNA